MNDYDEIPPHMIELYFDEPANMTAQELLEDITYKEVTDNGY